MGFSITQYNLPKFKYIPNYNNVKLKKTKNEKSDIGIN